MTTIIALLIVISVIIFVHELGHFFAARWAGARVDVFSVGFGRPLIKWRDRRGTEWRVAWLPFGGFTTIYGMEDMFNRKRYAELPAKGKIGHYLSLPAWKQAVIIGGGVFMNLALAWVIFTGSFLGRQSVQLPVVEHGAGALRSGDRIMQLNGVKINSWPEMLMEKELHAGGGDHYLVVLRGSKLVNVKMPAGKWGIAPDAAKTETIRNGLLTAMGKASDKLWAESKMMFVFLKQVVLGERSSKQLGGLLTIAQFSGQALAAGLAALFAIIAVLSVNLAVINLFPLPVLDGGYLLILLIEAVIRRKLQGRAMDWIMRVSWWLLIALMAFALWNDMARLVL
jgi:regulator of sigma E protease